ncbi:DUF3093 domain-containing protein [Mycolicibacterium sp. P1-5]|uniref:DUF3093 domain-containing protein n=1 Tax=Mycolicibacterium sp. P1-5 TaxID=2024617 RepID=UPI0011EDEEA1|nr:DUF3093 domain-containing protein [Mycolicibacterium sp. P1-5]KAA0110718.1 DUF3093 domain-containing protein [Mycolicibacterium sp. P1-5]
MPDDHQLPEQPERLFFESGASWYWLLAGPVSAITMLLIQFKGGAGFQPAVPLIFLVLVTGFLGIQVKAARIHTSVELTRESLRQGAEVTQLRNIVRVFPPPEHSAKSKELLEKWQTSRALGELSGVPRGRTGIGVELTGKRTAQAWARNHRALRAALTALVEGETADAS